MKQLNNNIKKNNIKVWKSIGISIMFNPICAEGGGFQCLVTPSDVFELFSLDILQHGFSRRPAKPLELTQHDTCSSNIWNP